MTAAARRRVTQQDPAARAWSIMGDLVLDNERRREVSDALGLPFGRIRALRRIAASPMTMGELATTLGTEKPYATIVVDELERQGLVERRPHPTAGSRWWPRPSRPRNSLARILEAVAGSTGG